MPTEDHLTPRLRACLANVPEVVERKMFGGTGFMVRGHLCLSGRAERILARIDPALHDEALAQPGCSTLVMQGRPMKGYLLVAAAAVAQPQQLQHWVDLALRHNATLPVKAEKKASTKTRRHAG